MADEVLQTGTHLIIDGDKRTIYIPPTIKSLGVESDDDVLNIVFEAPSMYGDVDLSTFEIRINYLNAKMEGDSYHVENPTVSDGVITFSWLVSRHATKYKGNVTFIVCFRELAEDGTISREWNTTIASLPVLEGLETTEKITQQNPDVLEKLLLRMMSVETLANRKLDINDLQAAINEALAQAKASGEFDGEDGAPGADGKDGKDGEGLPGVTASDNGKVLTVVDGEWTPAENAAQTTANEAKTAATNAATAAGTAQTTANEAKTAAGTAQTTANEAKTAASVAQATANGKAPAHILSASDITAGSTALSSGQLYLVYE